MDAQVGMPSVYPSDGDVIASSKIAIAELQRQIDHQSRDADLVDTKATAIVTLVAAATGIVVSRLAKERDDVQNLAVIAGFMVLAVFVVCSWQALRPRPGFSYGPNGRDMVAIIDRNAHKTSMLSVADSLVLAFEGNVGFIRTKHNWYRRELRTMVSAVVVIAWLAQTGVIT